MIPGLETELAKHKDSFHFTIEDAARDLKTEGEEGPAKLVRHILNRHSDPDTFAKIGLPDFDMRVASLVGIPLDEVVEEYCQRLERGWGDDKNDFKTSLPRWKYEVFSRFGCEWNERWFDEMLVKGLLRIQELGLGKINWPRVEAAFPGARDITLDIKRDSYDPQEERGLKQVKPDFLPIPF